MIADLDEIRHLDPGPQLRGRSHGGDEEPGGPIQRRIRQAQAGEVEHGNTHHAEMRIFEI